MFNFAIDFAIDFAINFTVDFAINFDIDFVIQPITQTRLFLELVSKELNHFFDKKRPKNFMMPNSFATFFVLTIF